jgi:four helix bundle protein
LKKIRNSKREIRNKSERQKAVKRRSEKTPLTYPESDHGVGRWIVAEEREKIYDLQERTFEFARRVRSLVKKVKPTLANVEDCRQLVKSSGSTGANYIEANESLSKKDFVLRIKISRKEAKESRYWLRLIDLEQTPQLENERMSLVQEAQELMNILGAIYRRTQTPGS